MNLGIVIRTILLSLLPASFTYLGLSDNIIDYLKSNGYLGSNFNVTLTKHVFTILSTLFVSVYLFYKHEKYIIRIRTLEKQRRDLIIDNKVIFLQALVNKVENENLNNLHIRIWVEKSNFSYLVKKWFFTKFNMKFTKVFTIRNVEGLSTSDITNDLSFKVYPDWQGMVGLCYNERKIIYDQNVRSSKFDYRLTDHQKTKINGTKFCMCAPIFTDKDEVISIISFDSESEIEIPNSKKKDFEDIVNIYSQRLYINCPEVFQ